MASPRVRFGFEGPRTNSLAFAKSDCHSCLSFNESCDRRRPRCGTCSSSHRKCGGFAMDLVWKDLAVSGRDSDSARLQVDSTKNHSGFKFIKGRAKRKRQPKDAFPTKARSERTSISSAPGTSEVSFSPVVPTMAAFPGVSSPPVSVKEMLEQQDVISPGSSESSVLTDFTQQGANVHSEVAGTVHGNLFPYAMTIVC